MVPLIYSSLVLVLDLTALWEGLRIGLMNLVLPALSCIKQCASPGWWSINLVYRQDKIACKRQVPALSIVLGAWYEVRVIKKAYIQHWSLK